MPTNSYKSIQSFLTNTLQIPSDIVDTFLKYNRIIFKRYTTVFNKRNIQFTDSSTNNNVNSILLSVTDISHDMTYLKDYQDDVKGDDTSQAKHVFFYPIFKNQTSQSYNISYTDDFTNLMQFDKLLDIATVIGDANSIQGLNNIVKFIENLFFKLNLPKLSQGVEDGSESFTITIPLIYFNVDKNIKSQPYMVDLSILYSYMTSRSSTIKIGKDGQELNILKPLDVYTYVELGNGFSYGLCGVESLSYSVENIRLQYDLPDNKNISNVFTNIVYVNVNITLQRIFPNVPIRYGNNIISLNYEVRNNKPISTRNYFVVSI